MFAGEFVYVTWPKSEEPSRRESITAVQFFTQNERFKSENREDIERMNVLIRPGSMRGRVRAGPRSETGEQWIEMETFPSFSGPKTSATGNS